MKRFLALLIALLSTAAVAQVKIGVPTNVQGLEQIGAFTGDCTAVVAATFPGSSTIDITCLDTDGTPFGTLATATSWAAIEAFLSGCSSGTPLVEYNGTCTSASGTGTVTSVQLTSTSGTVNINATSGANPCITTCVIDLETNTANNIICAQATATPATTTGTTAETNLENCTISAGLANVSGAMLRITATWYRNATTTDSTQFVVRMCNSSGCTSGGLNILSPTDSTSGSVQYFTQYMVYVTGTSAQLVPVVGSLSGTSGGSAPSTGTQNMAATQYIAFNCKNVTSSADTCGIYTWTVELVP